MAKKKLPKDDPHLKAVKEAKNHGGVKSIKVNLREGTQYNYKNGNGYWVDNKETLKLSKAQKAYANSKKKGK